MKYLCLAYEEEKVLNELTPAEWAALRIETLDCVESLRDAGQLIEARPLQSARTAATVRLRQGKLTTTDGPFAETREQLGGYFLIEARDMNAAIQIAAKWPSARLGSIEVRPVEDELRTDKRYV
ncbi:MAG: YciI family protein [Woeseia sp.]